MKLNDKEIENLEINSETVYLIKNVMQKIKIKKIFFIQLSIYFFWTFNKI